MLVYVTHVFSEFGYKIVKICSFDIVLIYVYFYSFSIKKNQFAFRKDTVCI